MPLFAHVSAEISCPRCGEGLKDLLAVQWGYCRGYRVREEASYVVGDSVRWRACQDGSIPSWSFFGDGEGNAGDPAWENLIVRDYWLDETVHSCGEEIGGAAIEIRLGVIARAWAYPRGELDNSSFYYLVDSDGTVSAMPEWDAHPMTWIDIAECGEQLRLITPRD
jgi:hypothetical protein